MKKTNIKTETYEIENGFLLDIVENEEEFESWLYHKKIGIKSFMFGVSKSETKENFINIVEANLDEYIEIYQEDYL